MNPGGGSAWDEPPLDIQVPDDARELDRDVLAYHRELRALRRRNRMRRLAGPFAARAGVMPLLASILAVCLVAGAMLSVATFSPATAPGEQKPRPTAAASNARPAPPPSSAPATTPAPASSAAASSAPASSAPASSAPASSAPASPSSTRGASRSGGTSAAPSRPGPSGSGSPGAPR